MPHLTELLAAVWTHDQWRAFQRAKEIVRRAAKLALNEWDPGDYLMEVPNYDRRITLSEPEMSIPFDAPEGTIVPPEVLQKLKEMLTGYTEFLLEAAVGRIPAELVDTQMLCRHFPPISSYLQTAILAKTGEDLKHDLTTGSKPTAWEWLVQELLKRSRTNCTETRLAAYAELIAKQSVPSSNEMSGELARLNDAGLGQELLERLAEEYPEVYGELKISRSSAGERKSPAAPQPSSPGKTRRSKKVLETSRREREVRGGCFYQLMD